MPGPGEVELAPWGSACGGRGRGAGRAVAGAGVLQGAGVRDAESLSPTRFGWALTPSWEGCLGAAGLLGAHLGPR